MDRILTFFDHPPTPSGQAWTFGLPPTPCPRGHLENDHPLIRPIQYAPHFAQTKVGIKEISFLCNIYLPKLGLDSLGKEYPAIIQIMVCTLYIYKVFDSLACRFTRLLTF